METTSRTPLRGEVELTRDVAIGHHHDVVSYFEKQYVEMACSRFSNAFTYGRYKVDLLLDQQLSGLEPGAKVLDIGCGTGAYLQRFGSRGFVPYGVEPAQGMRNVAERDVPAATILDGVATALPFPDATFDAVIAIEVFRYLHRSDTRVGFREARRVLKPGGVLFVTMVNRWALDGFYVLQRARQLMKQSKLDRKNPHCEFFTPRELETELSDVGFDDVRTIGRLFAPMRILYKVSEKITEKIAEVIEPFDDRLHELAATKPFAGHLVAVAKRPVGRR